MKWIICGRCNKAVPPEHVKMHLSSKHQIYYSRDALESIFSNHELMSLESLEAFKNETNKLENAINGILVEEGHKCIMCGHCTMVWGSMTEHFRNQHEGNLEAKQWTENG